MQAQLDHDHEAPFVHLVFPVHRQRRVLKHCPGLHVGIDDTRQADAVSIAIKAVKLNVEISKIKTT